ncbi:Hypothetical_protein [Hexamita inflata]|uniref:Hypothetical_protein n=1 Tax=Hexamita inflata TaxID=28002 RepID=A0AA86NAJ3_9EUKA|nr:Hypothetical protein HINF_LOCUS3505 [Hexamita inflata]
MCSLHTLIVFIISLYWNHYKYPNLYIPLTQLSFILAWSTFQAHVFAGNILNVGESASYPVIDGNIHLILSLLGLLLFALTLLIFLLGRQGCLFQNIFNVLDLLQGFNFLQEYLALGSVDEFMFVERLQDQYQVGLNLTNWRLWVVFNVNVNNFFQIAAYLLLLLFRINIFPMASQLAFDFNSYIVYCIVILHSLAQVPLDTVLDQLDVSLVCCGICD